jgi:hypothetical protein
MGHWFHDDRRGHGLDAARYVPAAEKEPLSDSILKRYELWRHTYPSGLVLIFNRRSAGMPHTYNQDIILHYPIRNSVAMDFKRPESSIVLFPVLINGKSLRMVYQFFRELYNLILYFFSNSLP